MRLFDLLASPSRTEACTDLLAVCERYSLLANDKKQMIAGELDRSVREIERKISVSVLRSTKYCSTRALLI